MPGPGLNMRILIFIGSQQIGFFISLTRQLSASGHRVRLVLRDSDVGRVIRRTAPDLSEEMVVAEAIETHIPPSRAIRRGLEVEKRYGVRLAMLLSYDRAMGRGYIFNADRYPAIKRARWGHERKLSHILERFARAEHLVDRHRPDIVIGLQKDEVFNVVASARKILYLTPARIKLGHRFIWSDNPFITSAHFIRVLKENVAQGLDALPPPGEYLQETGSKYNHARALNTWGHAFRQAGRVAINEVKALTRRRRKKDSYPLFGWVSPVLRHQKNYRFFIECGVRPDEIGERRAVYVPLHLEPEIALLALSPEFNNSMEMIAWISKSLPADALVVVKEQPFSFGVRSRRYYEQLLQIGNVVLAHPEATSWNWIRATTVTATITGTAAIEAVAFGRPVLSFGRHQAVNLLPTVRLAREYESTRSALDELFRLQPDDPAFELSRRAMHAAQISCSFEMSGFERTYKSAMPQDELAEKALQGLFSAFPALAGGRGDL